MKCKWGYTLISCGVDLIIKGVIGMPTATTRFYSLPPYHHLYTLFASPHPLEEPHDIHTETYKHTRMHPTNELVNDYRY